VRDGYIFKNYTYYLLTQRGETALLAVYI